MSPLARRVTVFAGLAAATALAAYALLGPNLDAWSILNADPQGFAQELESWLVADSFAVTSGTLVAQLGSLLFGWYAARTGASRMVAVAGALGLALVQLAVAVPPALGRVDRLWMVDEMTSHGHAFERDLWQQPQVVTAALVAMLSCLAWAAAGFGVARSRVVFGVLAALSVPLYVCFQSGASTTAAWWRGALGLLLLSAGAATLRLVPDRPPAG